MWTSSNGRLALVFCWIALSAASAGCGPRDGTDSGTDSGGGTDSGVVTMCNAAKSLDAYLPMVPAPTGGAQEVFAGDVTDSSELIDGISSLGMLGDYYLRNDRIRVVIQAPGTFYAWTRFGGNIVDADVVRGPGDPDNDQFGELSMFYRSGRSARFESCEVLQDGSGGGAAAIRCIGVDDLIDSLNIKSFAPAGFLEEALDPSVATPLDIAVTYILEPGADAVEMTWTYFNREVDPIQTNVGFIVDTGGKVEVFSPNIGFGSGSFSSVFSGGDVSPFYGYQAPGVAYGIVPYHFDASGGIDPELANAQITISGVSISIFAVRSLLEAFNSSTGRMVINGCEGWTQMLDFVVSASSVGDTATYAAGTLGLDSGTLSGTVTVNALPREGVRVAVMKDRSTPGFDDNDVTWAMYLTDANGSFAGDVPVGDYVIVADGIGLARDASLVDGAMSVSVTSGGMVTADFDLPESGFIDYDVVDAMAGGNIPARILVVGDDPSPHDRRIRDHDEGSGEGARWHLVNQVRFSITGSSAMDGGGIEIEPGDYRVFVSRGTEWSMYDEVVTVPSGGTVTVNAAITHVLDTTGYVASDMHQHAVHSPDAPVTNHERVSVYVAEGIEYIGASDHDFFTDYGPTIADLGVAGLVEASIGVETTTFDYGHFNAWPFTIDPTNPNGGIIDWADPDSDLSLTPDEIFMEHRARGGTLVQVNHPRGGGYFDATALVFDFGSGYVGDDPAGSYPDSPEVLRLPTGVALFSDAFDAFEIWNGFHVSDSNGDGILEDTRADEILRDWFHFTAFGLIYSGTAVSDSHKLNFDFAGYPRTYVAVPDDTAVGSWEADVLGNISRTGSAPGDLVLSNGPFLRVSADGGATSAVGALVDGSSGSITLDISAESPEWAVIDTLEIFVGSTDVNGTLSPAGSSALIPTWCFTDRMTFDPADSCAAAEAGAPMPLGVVMAPVGTEQIHVVAATHPLTITGDTFIFLRVTGNRAIFPISPDELPETVTPADVVAGIADFDGTGVPAMALVGPILVDFDGNGVYDAPYGL